MSAIMSLFILTLPLSMVAVAVVSVWAYNGGNDMPGAVSQVLNGECPLDGATEPLGDFSDGDGGGEQSDSERQTKRQRERRRHRRRV